MHYNSLSEYLKREYGEKLYKLCFSTGCSCPNRDGTLGTGGCIFCSAGGSGEFAEDLSGYDGTDETAYLIDKAVDAAVHRINQKFRGDKYIAYFQSYTNTYGDTDRLRKLYTAVVKRPEIAVLSIATRPDCLGEEVLAMLDELNRIKPVWVELGLQTSKPESAEYIRRGYDNSVYAKAVSALCDLEIKTVTHIILGLPGESFEDMRDSVRFACNCGTWGLKLQLLHVLRGTDLAEDYTAGRFSVLGADEYTDIICRLLPEIPENIVIHRLTGDGPRKLLIAPEWSLDKKRVINGLNRRLVSL